MSLRIMVQHLVRLQSWGSSLSTEHQLIRDFHHPVPHLEVGKSCILPGSFAHCVGSYLTPKLAGSSLPRKCRMKPFQCRKLHRSGYLHPWFLIRLLRSCPICICKSEASTFQAEPLLSFVDAFTTFGSFVLCTHAQWWLHAALTAAGMTYSWATVSQNHSFMFF